MRIATIFILSAVVAMAEPKSLFNGKDLSGWHVDVPAADKDPKIEPSFIVRDGKLVSMGKPLGHLITITSRKFRKLVRGGSEKGVSLAV